jgi:hypothetical protein
MLPSRPRAWPGPAAAHHAALEAAARSPFYGRVQNPCRLRALPRVDGPAARSSGITILEYSVSAALAELQMLAARAPGQPPRHPLQHSTAQHS